MALETVASGFAFVEGPRWRNGALWLSDMHDHKVLRVVPGDEPELVCHVPGQPSGLGWLPDGDLLVVSMLDRTVMRRTKTGELVLHANLSGLIDKRANDMVVNGEGVAYVGNFGFDLDEEEARVPTVLVCVDPDGRARKAADGLVFPNGMAITPGGGTLIVAETFAGRLAAFDIDADGALSNHRIWAALPEGVCPDGIALDEAGGVWVASPLTAACLRVTEGGGVTNIIDVGRKAAIACALGGEDRRTLFISTAETVDPDLCRQKRSAAIVAAKVEIPGVGAP
ncbi:MAG: SMP-30/gluconolactonase/LRE family protein [Pseudomonadota bacterium]